MIRRSFPDSGVLIAGARGDVSTGEIALAYLTNSNQSRRFLTSPFVRLEVVPKAEYLQRTVELAFYQSFLTAHAWNGAAIGTAWST